LDDLLKTKAFPNPEVNKVVETSVKIVKRPVYPNSAGSIILAKTIERKKVKKY